MKKRYMRTLPCIFQYYQIKPPFCLYLYNIFDISYRVLLLKKEKWTTRQEMIIVNAFEHKIFTCACVHLEYFKQIKINKRGTQLMHNCKKALMYDVYSIGFSFPTKVRVCFCFCFLISWEVFNNLINHALYIY